MIYDLILLVIFIVSTSLFLHYNRRNLVKDGQLYLYKTKWGMQLIGKIGRKYKKTLKFASYISIILGYILMIIIIYLILKSVYIYLTTSIIDVIKAPPIAPLIPYFPKLFGMESFFPPFYFIYFIIAIIIVATVHEFSHGIFAKRYNIKIKSTGFAFWKYFPAIFGAFVEQDENQMQKASKFKQMSILSAGVFANVLMAILFYALLFVFFISTFTASGVVFDTYSYSIVNINNITSVNGVGLIDYTQKEFDSLLSKDKKLNNIQTDEGKYVGIKAYGKRDGKLYLLLYPDAPAINSGIGAIITHINGELIDSTEKLSEVLEKYPPNQSVQITSINENGTINSNIILGQNPNDKTKSWLGIGFYSEQKKGFIGKLISLAPRYKQPNIYYKPANKFSIFVKDLLWWIFLINLLVALFNMLPLGILDGGRFFYLTIWSLTKSEKVAKRSFIGVTYVIILLFVVLMLKWVLNFF